MNAQTIQSFERGPGAGSVHLWPGALSDYDVQVTPASEGAPYAVRVTTVCFEHARRVVLGQVGPRDRVSMVPA